MKENDARLGIYDFLRIGHVKRWHNVNVTRQQTVAEHCFMVMLMALDMYNEMVGVKFNEGENWKELCVLLVGAMFHDAAEVIAGDTPTPAKRLLRELTGDPALFDKLDEYLMPELPYIGGKVPPALEEFIAMADRIDAYHFCHDNGGGTHALVVLNGARRNLENLVDKYDKANPGSGWYAAVNRILTSMGLPYVHKESRNSPP